MLGVLADVESKGGATVYRFTPASVRRALDAGRTAADLHAFLAEHSRTPVPQPLAYLIDDVARRHGHLRVGAASAYVRCDDDTLLNEILADRRAAALRLRRLAPTVLAAQTDPATLLEGLRAMGYAPAAESAEGDVLITRAHAHRTPPRTAPEPVPDGPPPPDATLLSAAIRAIRAGDLAATTPRKPVGEPLAGGELPRTSSAETLATMQAAVLTGDSVWIGYVNADGAASQRVIAPVRVEGGFVTAYDHTADEVRTFPLHRITGVAELAGRLSPRAPAPRVGAPAGPAPPVAAVVVARRRGGHEDAPMDARLYGAVASTALARRCPGGCALARPRRQRHPPVRHHRSPPSRRTRRRALGRALAAGPSSRPARLARVRARGCVAPASSPVRGVVPGRVRCLGQGADLGGQAVLVPDVSRTPQLIVRPGMPRPAFRSSAGPAQGPAPIRRKEARDVRDTHSEDHGRRGGGPGHVAGGAS